MVRISLPNRKYNFESLERLFELLNSDKPYQIQVFSLESIELFEHALAYGSIDYYKEFTSTYKQFSGSKKSNNRKVCLLFDDGDFRNFSDSVRLILYSNRRDNRFLPYKFILAEHEKEQFLENKSMHAAIKKLPITSVLNKVINLHEYIANSLGYIKCIILFCMLREKKFNKIFQEVVSVDPKLNNKFIVKCELNELIKYKFCKKIGETYQITLSKLTMVKICEKIGFDKALQFYNK